MYLASVMDHGHKRILIRQSYYDENLNSYSYRSVFDLGDNPGNFIHEFNDRVIYFDESLEVAVANELGKDPTVFLEELLWDYLPVRQRQKIEDFHRGSYIKLRPLSGVEQAEVEKYIHIFDRRRLFYIRYGAVDQSRIYRLNDKLYRPLLYKCRDEKEHYFSNLELSLSGSELKKYIYVIFNLQKYFSKSYSAYMPEALDLEHMDKAFIDELCFLNSDENFWQDRLKTDSLRHHLQNYLFRFFDYEFAHRSFAYDFIRDFRASHRKFRWPARSQAVSEEETSDVFGIKIEKLRKMGKTDLLKAFRKKAKEHHPDRGGDQEKFVTLLAAYEELKKRLKKTK